MRVEKSGPEKLPDGTQVGHDGEVTSPQHEGGAPDTPAPLLSVIVPAYNSQDYLDRALQSLVGYGDEVEVLIVNDGSSDKTAEMADAWAAKHPGRIKAIHQANAGHGGALNTGIRHATGIHLKVLDSDDWMDRQALREVLNLLRDMRDRGETLDLLVTNYVYEKVGRAHKMVIRYRNVLPEGRTIGWDEMKRCRYEQYMMMHALAFRTELVRESGMVLPEKTFYVDYLYSHVPLPLVHTIRYLDVDLYRYFIGREDQSVNDKVMLTRIDQLLRVNRGMIEAMPKRSSVPRNLYRYMAHYLRINSVSCSVMLMRSGTPEHLEAKERMWREFAEYNPEAYEAVTSDLLGRIITLRGPIGRMLALGGYQVSRRVLGYN